jgi:hypothetical protein
MTLRTRTEKAPTASGVDVASFLLVTCTHTHVAIPADIIRGIVKPDDDGKDDALAVLRAHTDVTDLADRFGVSSSSFSSEARIVVCGTHNARRAFRVHAIVGLEDVESTRIKPLLPHFIGPEREWFSGMFLFRETIALVVQPSWLLSDDRQRGGLLGRQSTVEPEQALLAAPVLSHRTGGYVSGSPDELDVIELEEATDADDLPWAQL